MISRLVFVFFCFLIGCNFHEIDRGRLYRSAQLDEKELREAIQKFGIKTIINLRGPNESHGWYNAEKRVTKELGVELVDIAMSAKRLPHRRDLATLLAAYRTLPRPILIHCKAGADRTGEAAAIYQMLYMGKTKDQALDMLGPKYFHTLSGAPAKHYFIKFLWQGEAWALNEYDPCAGEYKYYDVTNPECTGRGPRRHPTEDEDT